MDGQRCQGRSHMAFASKEILGSRHQWFGGGRGLRVSETSVMTWFMKCICKYKYIYIKYYMYYNYIYTQDLIVISFETCQIKPNDSFFHACCFSWHLRHSSCNKGVYHLQVYATGSFSKWNPHPQPFRNGLSPFCHVKPLTTPKPISIQTVQGRHDVYQGQLRCLEWKTSSSDVSEFIFEVTSKIFWTRTMLQSDANTKNWLSRCFCWDHLRWQMDHLRRIEVILTNQVGLLPLLLVSVQWRS